MRRSEDSLQMLVFSFYRVDSGHSAQLVSLGSKRLYLLSRLTAFPTFNQPVL